MSRLRRGKRRAKHLRPVVRIGKPDASLTGLAGLAAVEELVAALGVVAELDRAVGPIKERARGATGGQLLVGLATAQLCGQDCLAGLDGSGLTQAAPCSGRRRCRRRRPLRSSPGGSVRRSWLGSRRACRRCTRAG